MLTRPGVAGAKGGKHFDRGVVGGVNAGCGFAGLHTWKGLQAASSRVSRVDENKEEFLGSAHRAALTGVRFCSVVSQ